MFTEQGASRQQIGISAAVPVRFLHDLWVVVSADASDVAIAQSFEVQANLFFQVNARHSVSGGIDVPPTEQDVGWSDINVGLRAGATVSVGPDFELNYSEPVKEARSLYDDEGVLDFVRLKLTLNTNGAWTGKVVVNAHLWGNEQAHNLYPEIPQSEKRSHLADASTGEAL